MECERRVRTGQRPLLREVLLAGQWDMALEWEAMRSSSGGVRWTPCARLSDVWISYIPQSKGQSLGTGRRRIFLVATNDR